MQKFHASVLVIFLAAMAALGAMQPAVQLTEDEPLSPNQLKLKLEEKLPGIEIDSVADSPIADYYQVFYSGQLIYVSKNGQYIFNGSLLELADRLIDHSDLALQEKDKAMAPERKEIIEGMDESEMVVFRAANEKHHITVFTDVDCAYCRKLHKHVPELNQIGITVRYLAYPRAGIGSTSYDKLVSVWCADDRGEAMNQAKLQRQFAIKTCDNPVAAQYQLTRQFNLVGTPAIILENGELIPGYMAPDDLLARLEPNQGQQSPAAR